VSVVNLRYDFGPEHPAVAQKRAADEQKVAELVTKGIPAVRALYEDGGSTSYSARLRRQGEGRRHQLRALVDRSSVIEV